MCSSEFSGLFGCFKSGAMGPLVLLVLCFGLAAAADRKLTVWEKIQDDADLSQVQTFE